jgi:hypothetical protein
LEFLQIQDDENKENNLLALKAILAEHPKNGTELDDVVELEHFGKIIDWFSPFDSTFMTRVSVSTASVSTSAVYSLSF